MKARFALFGAAFCAWSLVVLACGRTQMDPEPLYDSATDPPRDGPVWDSSVTDAPLDGFVSDGPVGTGADAGATPAPTSFGPQQTVVLLLNFPDRPDQPFTTTFAESQVFSGATSLDAFVQEVSYGQASLTGAVYGWFTLPENMTTYCSTLNSANRGLDCDLYALRRDAIAAADATVSFQGFTRLIMVYEGTGFGGWSDTYGSTLATADGPLQTTSMWLSAHHQLGLNFLAHELGHNLGARYHARSWVCPGNGVGPDLDDLTAGGCSVGIEGHDPLGVSTHHYSAYHKKLMGYMSAQEIASATESGTFTLGALELSSTGLKALEVPLTAARSYFVEYRRTVGFDGTTPAVEGVVVRLQLRYPITTSATGDTLLPNNFLVVPGRPFVDQYRGITIEIVSFAGDEAVVRVTR